MQDFLLEQDHYARVIFNILLKEENDNSMIYKELQRGASVLRKKEKQAAGAAQVVEKWNDKNCINNNLNKELDYCIRLLTVTKN